MWATLIQRGSFVYGGNCLKNIFLTGKVVLCKTTKFLLQKVIRHILTGKENLVIHISKVCKGSEMDLYTKLYTVSTVDFSIWVCLQVVKGRTSVLDKTYKNHFFLGKKRQGN